MAHKTVHGKDKHRLAEANHAELLTAWHRIFRHSPEHRNVAPPDNVVMLGRVLVTATSPLRVDFEIMRQRGTAFEGETIR